MDVRMLGFDLQFTVSAGVHGAGKGNDAVTRFESGGEVPCSGNSMDHDILADRQFVHGARQRVVGFQHVDTGRQAPADGPAEDAGVGAN